MNKNLLLSFIATASLTTPAQADYLVDLHAQIFSSSGEIEFDDSPSRVDTDQDGSIFGGTVFFSRVSTLNVPIREAAFLSQISSVTLSRRNVDIETTIDGNEFDDSSESTALQGRFVIPGSRIILIGGHSTGEIDYDLRLDYDVDSYLIGGGWYVTNNSTLTLTYSESQFDTQSSSDIDINDSEWLNLTYRQVLNINSNNHMAFYVTAESYDDGYEYDGFTLSAAVTWYFNNQFGIGARLVSTAGEDNEYDYEDYRVEFSPYFSYDFNETFGVCGELNMVAGGTDYDFGDDEEFTSTGVTFGANVRF